MPKKVTWYDVNVPSINWHRAIISGVCGSLIMMAFIDTLYMAQITPFCFENYLGSLITMRLYSGTIWTWGFLAMLVMGGVFGTFYGFMFEFVYEKSSARLGTLVGFYHTVVAAAFVFPFFQIVESAAPVQLYANFGILGSGLSASTPMILFLGHLIFGACVGTFYGPVRMERVRAQFSEPEDTVYHRRQYPAA